MPLVRLSVRNEYGLGVSELYKDAVEVEDPKAVLDGVAVAGLVGILRQLGDLTQFAAEVFHGLQEQVAFAASRSRKLVTRVQRVETSLPQIEKVILSQTSHIHFAYTQGSKWHPHIKNGQNSFINDDLPPFLMDSYENCREPPRLQLLDRFDTGGPGSCLRRYSDPSFFKGVSGSYDVPNGERPLAERKARKIKRRRSSSHTHFARRAHTSNDSERKKLSTPTLHGRSSQSRTGSTLDTTFKSDLGEKSYLLGEKSASHPSTSKQQDCAKAVALSSGQEEKMVNAHESIYFKGQEAGACSPISETTIPHCSSVTWDEKMEITQSVSPNDKRNDTQHVPETNMYLDDQELEPSSVNYFNQVHDLSEQGSPPKSNVDDHYCKTATDDIQDVPKAYIDLDEQELKFINGENVNTQDVPKAYIDLNEQELEFINGEDINQVDDLSKYKPMLNSHADGNNLKTVTDENYMEPSQPTGPDSEIDEIQNMFENYELHDHDLEPANMKGIAEEDLSEGENSSELMTKGDPMSNHVERNLGISEDRLAIETNYDKAERELEAFNVESGCQVDTFSEGENTVTVVEWNKLDDVESETDHYVDALNVIESDYESDFESQSQKELVLFSSSNNEQVGNFVIEHEAEMITHQESECECRPVSHDHKKEIPGDMDKSTALVSSVNMDFLECVQPSSLASAAETIDHQEPEHECPSVSYDYNESSPFNSRNSTALMSSIDMESLELASHKEQIPDDLQASTALVSSVNVDSFEGAQLSAAEIIHHQEPEHECDSISCDYKKPILVDSHTESTALVSTFNVESLELAQSSCNVSATAEEEKPRDSVDSFDETSVPYNQSSSAVYIPQGNDICTDKPTVSENAAYAPQVHPGETSDSPHIFQETSVGPSCTYPLAFNVESPEVAQSSCNVSAAEEEKPRDSADSFDEKSVPYNQSSSAVYIPQGIDICTDKPTVSENVASASQVHPGETSDGPHIFQETSVGPSCTYPLAFNVESLELAQSSCNVSAAAEEETPKDSADSFDGKSVSCNQSSSVVYIPQGTDICPDKPTASGNAASAPQVPPGETSDSPHICQEISVGPSCTYPLAFWTNGTLLGLEPLKPTVSTSDPMSRANIISIDQSNPVVMQKVDGSTGFPASSERDLGSGNCSKKPILDNDMQNAEFSKHVPHQIMSEKHNEFTDRDQSNLAGPSLIHGLNNGVMPHETKVPSTVNVKKVSTEGIYTHEDRSSLLSVLGSGLLKNGLRARSSSYEVKPESTSPLCNDFDNRSYSAVSHSMPEAILKGISNSPVNSPPPSPTIEHMKISFQPVDGFETSRLKLKYPEGVDHHETMVASFPSFQLVPELTNLNHGSDSDDDTFCRSYACMSDDYPGYLSDSNSVEWESGDTSLESNDRGFDDDLHRRAFTESTSSFPQHEETADGSIDLVSRFVESVHSERGSSFDLPLLDTKNPFAHQSTNQCRPAEVDSSHFQQLKPQTPPLPPFQWRVSRPQLDAEYVQQDQGSHSLNQSLDHKLSGSIISDIPMMDSAKIHKRTEDSTKNGKANELNEKKLDPQRGYHEVVNGKKTEGKDDILYQIRTKSFNLKHTERARSINTTSTVTTTSTKVTAILQKADAIRRVVGSDGEDDSSWSDT